MYLTVRNKVYYYYYWGRVTHICVSKLTIIGSGNGLSPGRRQAIIWNNAGILLIWPLQTNCSEILIEIHTFSFKKIHLKISSGKWRPFCLGLNVLRAAHPILTLTEGVTPPRVSCVKGSVIWVHFCTISQQVGVFKHFTPQLLYVWILLCLPKQKLDGQVTQ